MLIFLSILIVFGVGAYIGYKRIKPMMGSKNLIKRDGAFWEDGEIFYTSAAYEDVLDSLERADLSECRTEMQPNAGGKTIILFQSQDSWTAALKYFGFHEDEHQFEFQFTSWNTRRLGTSVYSMNILLTIVEKIFLSLDPDTEAEIHILDTETVTRFL